MVKKKKKIAKKAKKKKLGVFGDVNERRSELSENMKTHIINKLSNKDSKFNINEFFVDHIATLWANYEFALAAIEQQQKQINAMDKRIKKCQEETQTAL